MDLMVCSIFVLSAILAFFLKIPIINYYKSKPLGKQQVTDRLFRDLSCSLCFCVVPLCAAVAVKEVVGTFPAWLAATVVGYVIFSRFLVCCVLASASLVRFANAFFHSRVSEVSDNAVVWVARMASLALAVATTAVKMSSTQQRSKLGQYLSGEEVPSSSPSSTHSRVDLAVVLLATLATASLCAHCAVEALRIKSRRSLIRHANSQQQIFVISKATPTPISHTIAQNPPTLVSQIISPSSVALPATAAGLLLLLAVNYGGLIDDALPLDAPVGALAIGVLTHGVVIPIFVILFHPKIRKFALKNYVTRRAPLAGKLIGRGCSKVSPA